ncbi:MAG TPA: AtzH-like domain-containing protein [Pyrinomonadaceae bacterium]|nr:AtzH-like domain-containing protein [Pyrinomonadaceae bacterium]
MNRTLILTAILLMIQANVPAVASQYQSNAATQKRPNKHHEKVIAGVRAVLDAQVEAWNRGDLESFMDGYLRGSETVFVSGDNVVRGWQTVLDRYKKTYDSREKMGTLAFSELEITSIGRDAAVALGRWQLTRAGDTPHGRFTLIFRRTAQGWRIVHDHTSSAS